MSWPALDPDCKLCAWITETPINATDGGIVSVDDRYPVSQGHVLILPRRHVPNFFALTPEEHQAVWRLVVTERARLTKLSGTESFNVGINDGISAGQTVGHAHLHVIPRFEGDVDDPRGGVRGVIPERQQY